MTRRSQTVEMSAVAGYWGTMRTTSLASLITSTIGAFICRTPRKLVIFPLAAIRVPGASWRARHGWLKNTSVRFEVPSERIALRGAFRRCGGGALTLRTSPMIVTSSPTPTSRIALVSEKSRWRRG